MAQVWRRMDALAGQPFGTLLPPNEVRALRSNKGGTGAAIERVLGVPSGPERRDLLDGEIKSFHCDRDGFPLESVAICQIGANIDAWLSLPRYRDTVLREKVERLILCGVCKSAPDPADWFVVLALELDARPGTYWYGELERSYRAVMAAYLRDVDDGVPFRTVNGPWLQLRVRDHRPYTPVWSDRLGRTLSNKNIGFYFPRRTVVEWVNEALASGARTER